MNEVLLVASFSNWFNSSRTSSRFWWTADRVEKTEAEPFGANDLWMSYTLVVNYTSMNFFLISFVIFEQVRHELWMRIEWTLRDKNLTSRPTKNGTARFKNVNNCLITNIYSYLETSDGQSSNLYLNVVHFSNFSVN